MIVETLSLFLQMLMSCDDVRPTYKPEELWVKFKSSKPTYESKESFVEF